MFCKRFFIKFDLFYEMGFINYCHYYFGSKITTFVSEYIQSDFINNIGLGIAIFIFTLFITILIGKTLSRTITWTGVGSVDKGFGLLFGFFKGYVVAVCLFSIFNWFYPYQNWGISAEKAISFNYNK